MSDIDRDRDTPNDSSARYMNAYERAHARQHMEQAMALADLSLRAWGGIRTAAIRIANLFRGQDGPGAGDTVVRRGCCGATSARVAVRQLSLKPIARRI